MAIYASHLTITVRNYLVFSNFWAKVITDLTTNLTFYCSKDCYCSCQDYDHCYQLPHHSHWSWSSTSSSFTSCLVDFSWLSRRVSADSSNSWAIHYPKSTRFPYLTRPSFCCCDYWPRSLLDLHSQSIVPCYSDCSLCFGFERRYPWLQHKIEIRFDSFELRDPDCHQLEIGVMKCPFFVLMGTNFSSFASLYSQSSTNPAFRQPSLYLQLLLLQQKNLSFPELLKSTIFQDLRPLVEYFNR